MDAEPLEENKPRYCYGGTNEAYHCAVYRKLLVTELCGLAHHGNYVEGRHIDFAGSGHIALVDMLVRQITNCRFIRGRFAELTDWRQACRITPVMWTLHTLFELLVMRRHATALQAHSLGLSCSSSGACTI